MAEDEFEDAFHVDYEMPENDNSINFLDLGELTELVDYQRIAYEILKRAASLKGVAIKRDTFLSTELKKRYPQEIVDAAITTSPHEAGIPMDVIDELATAAVDLETKKVSGLSALAGIPGGLAMFGTIPADITQYFAHALRVEQKLAYLYGWQSFLNEEDEVDDETIYRLIMFLGVMMQVGGISVSLTNFAMQTASASVAKTIQKQALTKTFWYTPMKKILSVIGIKVTKESFAEVVAKGVPIVGGAVSGGLTYATFKPGANNLKNYLRLLPQATGVPMTKEEMMAAYDKAAEESKVDYAEAMKNAASTAGKAAGVAAEKAGVAAGIAADAAGSAAKTAASGLKRGFEGVSSKISQTRKKEELPASETNDTEAQLRALKGLYDDGIITKEEFEAKKRQILGL